MENNSTSFLRKAALPLSLLILVIAADQYLKIWVKTHMLYNETIDVLGSWFKLHFIENEGMAFGIVLGGKLGKLALTLFRMVVSIFGGWYLVKQIRKNAPVGLQLSIALILAGAIGNIIDSVFYGEIFKSRNDYVASWFYGHVVDMFYFPLFNGTFPKWMPFWGGEDFLFFSPVFNLADAAITIGVLMILIWQKKYFPQPLPVEPYRLEEFPTEDGKERPSESNPLNNNSEENNSKAPE